MPDSKNTDLNANGGGWGPVCPNGTCVDAKRGDDGVLVTSTTPGNDGAVTFTHAEWDAFVGQVKAGSWDHTVS